MPLPSENNATLAPLIHSQEYHPQTGRGLTHEALERLELDRWPCVTFSEVRNNFLGFVWAKCATASCVSCPRHGPGKGFFRVLKHHADMQNMDPGATRAAVCSARRQLERHRHHQRQRRNSGTLRLLPLRSADLLGCVLRRTRFIVLSVGDALCGVSVGHAEPCLSRYTRNMDVP